MPARAPVSVCVRERARRGWGQGYRAQKIRVAIQRKSWSKRGARSPLVVTQTKQPDVERGGREGGERLLGVRARARGRASVNRGRVCVCAYARANARKEVLELDVVHNCMVRPNAPHCHTRKPYQFHTILLSLASAARSAHAVTKYVLDPANNSPSPSTIPLCIIRRQ